MTVPFAHLGPHIMSAFGAAGQIKVERRSGGLFDQSTGLWDRGSLSVITMTAAVMPAKQSTVALLPDNARSEEMISIFTERPLKLPSTDEGTQSDVVIYRSKRYLVQFVEDWTVNAGFCHSIASLMGRVNIG